ncbi:hypothetical protein [Bacteroides congonensis]|uniref:hypothetical protein n=1 Tax=Bacteroides congonensis TaxID=1871006 RepID=UPI003A8912CE
MKTVLLKNVVVTLVVGLATTSVSGQGFLKKLQKAADKVESVTKTVETATGSVAGDEQASDSISPSDFLTTAPLYQVKKVIETDEAGAVITNEDGTTKYKYLLIDKDGKVCDRKTAKKHLNSALKSGSFILLKVGGGAAGGALLGKKAGGKKGALIGAGVGAAAGLLASSGDIKKVKEQMKLMKACKKVLKEYENTFTEEGTPIDASIDLTNVNGINFAECEEITKSAADVRNEFAASKTEGESLEDIELPDDLKV